MRLVDPRLDSHDVERAKQERLEEMSPIIATAHGRTDNHAATDFIRQNQNLLRYVPTWHKWLVWDGRRWKLDHDGVAVTRLARKYVDSYWEQLRECSSTLDPKEFAVVAQWVRSANQVARVDAIVKLARCDQLIVVDYEQLNTHRGYLNVLNGTLDFDTGELRSHNPDDNITQLANAEYRPGADCKKWIENLHLIFEGDAELIRYVQQLLGYSCTGYCGEAILPVCYGSGANGKSTIWNSMVELLGDYALVAGDKLIMGESREHATELANLYQRRFVAISEPQENAKLNESRVKALTGDAFITGRRMKEDYWTFHRTHKFWLSTNHLPNISGLDDGIWRRIKVMPFLVNLAKKVVAVMDYHKILVSDEGPGILNWVLAGYRDYQANGFIEPVRVKAATFCYRGDSDRLSKFITDCLEVDRTGVIRSSELWQMFVEWNGKESEWTRKRFSQEIAKRFGPSETPKFGPHRDKAIFRGLCKQTTQENE